MLQNSQKAGPLALFALVLILVTSGCRLDHEFSGSVFPEPVPVPEIALDSAAGPVQLQDFSGKYTFVYFGYTFCPDVCPVTLARLKEVRQELGNKADQVAVVMVTVDPERDTPEKLAEYMAYFDPTFVGLSGQLTDIDALGVPFGLFHERHEGSAESGYLVDHSAYFYLLDRSSRLIVAYPHETDTDGLVADVRYLLRTD